MNIAYLITAYGQWAHLERLVGALDDDGVGFFIHIDARSNVPPGLEERLGGRGNVWFAPRRKVWWGGWSHTAAILSLMEMATNAGKSGEGAGWDYLVVMSGGDYPIRSNAAIRERLGGGGEGGRYGGEFINAAPGFRPDKPESRVSRYWFDGFDRRSSGPRAMVFKALEALLRLAGIGKRRRPFDQIRCGIVWSALSGGCVRWMLDYMRAHPEYVRFFRTALVPEEMFFATLVGMSPFAGAIRATQTFMDWNHDSPSPPLIRADHLPRLATCDRLFARKFDDGSGQVIEKIEELFKS